MRKRKKCTILTAVVASLALSTTVWAAPRDIQGHWAQSTINTWVERGDISGYPDGTFRPNGYITRAEFVILVNNAMGYTQTGYASFADVPSYYWGRNAIRTGVAAGYISGDGDGSFRPNDPVTRQEAAVMISRILQLGQDNGAAAEYRDLSAMSRWAIGQIGSVSEAGIMAGYPDGTFRPLNLLTRAEAVVSLDKTMQYEAEDTQDDKDTDTEDKTDTKNVTLTKNRLEDETITGDLTISERLGSKSVTLDNVTVKGRLIVDGGGTVTLRSCDIDELVLDQKDVTIQATGKTDIQNTTFRKAAKLSGGEYQTVVIEKEFSSDVIIDADVRNLTLDAETDVRLLSDAKIRHFEITKNADRATIDFSDAQVDDMDIYDKITITGEGDIDTMTVYVSGVTSSIRPDTVKTKEKADEPEYTDEDDWGSSGRRYRSIRVSADRSGGTYNHVTVTADGVDLKNMTVRSNLYIDSAVADGEVTAENLTVRGNVYINGGGDASVVFQNCRVNGNIYVNKTVNGEPVAVKFDQTTAQNCKGTVIVQNNGAVLAPTDSASEVKLPKVTVETQKAVAIQTNVAELRVTVDQSALTIGGIVDWLWTDHTVFMTLVGNGEVRKTDGAVTETIAVESIQLDETTLKLTEGEARQLKATVNPENATNRTVEWKSSDTTIATVEETGKVTAVKAGDATITATADGKTAECQVTVEPKIVPVESIQLDETTLKLTEGEARQLKATVNPENATNRTVEWKSSDTTIATVEETGKVTAVKAGDATITATADGKTAKCQVTTVEPVAVTGVSLSPEAVQLAVGTTTTLKATVAPDNATNQKVTWSSSNPEVATVEGNGLITAKAIGQAEIEVKTAAGAKTAICKIEVTAAATGNNVSMTMF